MSSLTHAHIDDMLIEYRGLTQSGTDFIVI